MQQGLESWRDKPNYQGHASSPASMQPHTFFTRHMQQQVVRFLWASFDCESHLKGLNSGVKHLGSTD